MTEAALPIALGIRADGGWDSLGGWTTLGLVAVLVLLVKGETALVTSRGRGGAACVEDTAAVAAPRRRPLRRAAALPGGCPSTARSWRSSSPLLALAAALLDLERTRCS